MATFVDPRADPVAAVTKPFPRTTSDLAALTELHRLCRDSRIYDVERWIQAGWPLQAAPGTPTQQRRVTSALEIALEAGNHALILLLLCNGYDANIESRSPLDLALRARQWDLLDLLLEWGADPKQVSLGHLFDTYSTELFRRFRSLGVDLTANHEMAEALAHHTSNKPLFGFANVIATRISRFRRSSTSRWYTMRKRESRRVFCSAFGREATPCCRPEQYHLSIQPATRLN